MRSHYDDDNNEQADLALTAYENLIYGEHPSWQQPRLQRPTSQLPKEKEYDHDRDQGDPQPGGQL